MRFVYVLLDEWGDHLRPADIVEADNFGHAMQKLVAMLPEPDGDVDEIQIQRGHYDRLKG